MRAYSMDLRLRVLADCDAGLGTSAVATKYSVCPAWIRRLRQRRRQTGEIAPRPARPGPKPGLGAGTPDGERLAALARTEADLTAREYRDRLGLACHPTTVWRALRRLGLTFKKK
jgi:transposase